MNCFVRSEIYHQSGVYRLFSLWYIFFLNNLVVLVLTNLSTSVAIDGFHTAFFVGSCMRCRYYNCFPVFGHVIVFTLFSNTSIPCITALISTSPVLSSMIALRRKGGMFSFVRGSSNWALSSIICFFCTCCIIFRVGCLCVALTSGRLYVLSLITLKFSGQLSLLSFPF